MSDDFSADLEHAHRLIDAGIEAYLVSDSRPLADRRTDATQAIDLLRRHIYFEEEYLFPPLRALGLVGPVSVMVHEHGAMWRALEEFEELIADTAAVDVGRDLCAELLRQLAAHNWKEETIVYAQARQLLPNADQLELSRLLSGVEVPSGWVSQGPDRP